MADYIKREGIIRDMKKHCVDCDNRKGTKNGKTVMLYDIGDAPCRSCALGCMIDIIEDYPAADVRENVRGHWLFDSLRNRHYCSNCYSYSSGRSYEDGTVDLYNFCHNCGADMRGETDEKGKIDSERG